MINQPGHRFNHYQLPEEIKEALWLLEYEAPTPIQREMTPIILGGNNIVVKAPTEDGKTAAFVIPICETAIWRGNAPQTLIVELARELAEQVKDEVFRIGWKKRLKVPTLFGGFPVEEQIRTLRWKSYIVVGTPGRVVGHIRQESFKLGKITHLVIDEVDLALDMGFIDEVKEAISCLPKDRGASLFSATLKPEIQNLVGGYIEDVVLTQQEEGGGMEPAITQVLHRADKETKYDTFLMVPMTESPENRIIFCGIREMVNVLSQKLRKARVFYSMLHGDLEQKERLKTMDTFRWGAFRYLIATGMTTRGVDFENISHVVDYDFPTGKETYVHRVGRAGRSGKGGRAIGLVYEEDQRTLQMAEIYMDWELPVTECPIASPEEVRVLWKPQWQKTEIKPEKERVPNEDIMCLSIGS